MNTSPDAIRQKLSAALNAAAQAAWQDASGSHQRASTLCALVACGHERNVPAATAAVHLAAFDAMTLAQVGEFTGALDGQRAQALMQAAKAGQGRALDFEARDRAGTLAPSDMFFDDVLPLQALGPRPQGFADDSQAPQALQPAPSLQMGQG